jgi:hypothetical protein
MRRFNPTVPRWMLPYKATIAKKTGEAIAVGETEATPTYTKTENVVADIQPMGVDARGRSGLSMDSYGQEVRVTHIGTFEVSAGISEGDLVKFEDGPEAGRHFLVKIESNVRDHHLEPFLELQIDHTTNDTIGGL